MSSTADGAAFMYAVPSEDNPYSLTVVENPHVEGGVRKRGTGRGGGGGVIVSGVHSRVGANIKSKSKHHSHHQHGGEGVEPPAAPSVFYVLSKGGLNMVGPGE